MTRDVLPVIVVLIAAIMGITSSQYAAAMGADQSPIGVWATPDGESHIQIKYCGATLCGTIVWLRDPFEKDGRLAVDSKNLDPRLRARPLVGLFLLSGFVRDADDPDQWTGGTIYDPSNGKTYSCTITVEGPQRIRVRGFIGLSIFGVTQIWTRVTETSY